MKKGIYYDLSNEEYHNQKDYLSSSMIKLILQNPELYYKTYVKNEKQAVSEELNKVFDVGTAIHARILESHVYEKTVTFYSKRKQGKEWDEFKEANKDKLILGDVQKMQLDRMYDSFMKSELGPKLISGGKSEVSLFTSLESTNIRVRADYINESEGKIFDLKSTSGIISEDKFNYNLESKLYGYDLQAALYVDAFSKLVRPRGYENSNPYEFYWVVMSKDFDDIKFFKASPELIEQGRKKYKKALSLIKEYEQNGWEFNEKIIEVFPSNHGVLDDL